MKSHEANQKYALLVVIGLLMICSILPGRASRFVAHVPRVLVKTVTDPFVGLINAATGTVGGRDDLGVDDQNDKTLEEKIEQLRENVDQLNVENQKLRLLLGQKMRELQDLQQYYDNANALGIKVRERTLPSSIRVSRVHGHFITLSKGTTANIREGDVVVSGANLIGEVVEAAPTYATVRMITANQLPLAVRIVAPAAQRDQRGDQPVPLELAPHDEAHTLRGVCRKNDPVAVGDIAIMADPKWEAAWGYFVGVVTKLDDDLSDPLNFQYVDVQPRRDLAHLRSVIVIASGRGE